ncbi:MAG: archease [Thaumarchaeota archaeon]|jgi:SHS2 domain-containing protein|nr:archease [Nitrososphaerota archaeon]
MTYKFLPDVALADIAFEAESDTVNGLFESCAMALTDIMVDPKTLRGKVTKEVSLKSVDLERLLYDFLTELIVIKDVESLLFSEIHVDVKGSSTELAVVLRGEPIDRVHHTLRNDVKAVTMHMFGIRQEGRKWKATVVLDI